MRLPDKLVYWLEQVFCTIIGWIAITAIGVIVFGIFSPNNTFGIKGYEWCNWAALSCAGGLVLFTCVEIAFMIMNVFKKGE